MHGGHTWDTEAGGPGLQGQLYHELHPQPGFFFLPNLYCIIFQNTPKLERAVMNSAIPSA